LPQTVKQGSPFTRRAGIPSGWLINTSPARRLPGPLRELTGQGHYP